MSLVLGYFFCLALYSYGSSKQFKYPVQYFEIRLFPLLYVSNNLDLPPDRSDRRSGII